MIYYILVKLYMKILFRYPLLKQRILLSRTLAKHSAHLEPYRCHFINNFPHRPPRFSLTSVAEEHWQKSTIVIIVIINFTNPTTAWIPPIFWITIIRIPVERRKKGSAVAGPKWKMWEFFFANSKKEFYFEK